MILHNNCIVGHRNKQYFNPGNYNYTTMKIAFEAHFGAVTLLCIKTMLQTGVHKQLL